ncbi:hypothetical protein lerEdw1_002431 [Lerista edwardsae]|nr:hypothetical protein lerEdw1_002431 [Lerista edwardsae]
MKTALLYVSLVSLVWAQSDLESHNKKAEQKCMGEHQIMVKGRHTKHGFYVFNYVYSSLVPNNQTQIKNEDRNKNISNATPWFGKGSASKKPLDNLTAQQKKDQHKHVAETRKDRTDESSSHPESGQNWNGHHGSPRKWGLYQHHLEFFGGKGENETGDAGLDGSGDMGFLNQVDSPHGLSIDSGHDQGKERQDPKGTGYERPLEKGKDGKSGLSGNGKLSKGAYVKIGEKKTGASIFQDTSSNSSIPRKRKDPQSKVYSKVVLKGQTDATHKTAGERLPLRGGPEAVRRQPVTPADSIDKGPGREGGGYADVPDKTKEPAASNMHTPLQGRGNISALLPRKTENKRNGRNMTYSSDTDDIKIASGKVVKIKVEKEGTGGHTLIMTGKLNEEKIRSGGTKPAQKGEVKDDGFGGSHVEVAGAIKTREIGITGRLINPGENPVYTTSGKTGQRDVILRGKLNDHVSGSGVSTSHPKVKDEVTILKRISDSRVSGLGSIQQGRKGASGIGIIHQKSNTGQEGFGFTSAHLKDVGSHEKINRKAHEGLKMQGKNRLGIAFQEANQDIVKGKVESSKAAGITADLKRSNVDSFKRKVEHSGQKSSGLKSALSPHHGSHDNIKHGLSVPKKSPEHSSSSYQKVTKTSKQRSKATPGTYGVNVDQKHQGHSGIWKRKSHRPDKKRPSVKRGHRSDSSESSESDEDSRHESRQSYKDYQNDTPDSYRSVESVEQSLSVESNQSDDDHSQMEDPEPYSQEGSHERKSN